MSGIGERRSARHVVVPYGAANATVRARALHWIERLDGGGPLGTGDVLVHGPGFPRTAIPDGEAVLLIRNVRKLTRGRSETSLLTKASLGVYDLDDGLPWDDGSLPRLGRWWKRPFPRSLVAERAADAADRVVVGNEVLADWAELHCPDVRVVPTCVEPSDYRPRTHWEIGERPVIGWIGSPATEIYLHDVAEALAEVNRRTGAVLRTIGGSGHIPPVLAGFTSDDAWTPASTTAIGTWDVGIMPLHDGIYERAKCGYKLLQYAASGIPAVGSPVGVNVPILEGMDGLAPGDRVGWVDSLCEILNESSARRQVRAERGLALARQYSYEAWQDRWVDAVGWACASSM